MTLQAAETSSRRQLIVCGATDIGAHRAENQDTFVVADLASGTTSQPCIRSDLSVSRPGVLLLVCDGMGGRPAGEVAARVAAKVIKQDVRAAGTHGLDAPGPTLENAVADANRVIFAEAGSHPEEKGMGTTCTAAILSPERLSLAQVGDSRAYRLRDGHLELLTRDQTMASEMLASGALKPEQLATFPYRHVLLQALGSEAKVRPVLTEVDVREGDRLLLCSDGLHGPVTDDVISAILRAPGDVASAARGLIAAALAAGGPDNVTVVVADCGASEQAKAEVKVRAAKTA